ncbi:hypothetical protein C1645_731660 [Glomus cerebriforme]|uniref:Uncharacterized protein n=1 Tax=Glomus cerebriforme TaxID=658196 RepID=A0A397TKE4_9GLOM|nr:hypothetical protein C1645_731660 [Glomus cerebriforme]
MKEQNTTWMLNSPNPSPLCFFRFTFPMNRSRAFDTYSKVLTSAIEKCREEAVKERLQKMRNAEIQKDWELWLEERKAVWHTTNNGKCADEKEEFSVKNHKDEDKDEADEDEADKDEVDKDEDGGSFATTNDDTLVPDEDFKFVERHEPDTIGRTKRWILSSGTDVGQVLTSYRYLIPESQKCVNPVYWGILDLTGTHPETKQLFSTVDWTEMLKSFEDEIEIKEDIPDVVYLFFDEVEQIIKDVEESGNIVTEIGEISSRKIKATYKITLNEQDKAYINEIKRAVLTYINKLEAITGLRSGGLPEPHRKKNFSDFLDLSITMRDVLHAFFNSNASASDEDLHKIFVLGVQSLGYGKLCTTALPNSIRTLACLENFYVEMKNVKATLNSICNKANDIALSHARAHRRKRKGKDREEHANIEIGGCFGKITGTPHSKKYEYWNMISQFNFY